MCVLKKSLRVIHKPEDASGDAVLEFSADQLLHIGDDSADCLL